MKMSFKNTWVALRERSVSESIPEEHFIFLRRHCLFFNFKHIELFPHIHGVSLVLSLNKYLQFRIKINNIK